MTIQECVVESIQRAVPELEASVIGEMLEIPPDKKMGDYAFPCFRLAKQFRKAPALIAQDPYVNVFVNKEKIVELVRDAFASQEQFGSSQEGEGKTIVLDYSSINIAKPFHIGHLRTTAIGNAIHKLYRYLGYNTVRIN